MTKKEVIVPADDLVCLGKDKLQELIRCKGCKYFINSGEKCLLIDTRLNFYERDKRWTEDSFCAWAERMSLHE